MFDTEMCDKIKCLKQTFLILHSPKNRDYRSKLDENWNINCMYLWNAVFGLMGPLNLENGKRYKNSAVNTLKAVTERNPMKKIPSKLDEK